MGHSQRLRLSDVRAVFRLVGELRELGAEPATWRRHMLERLHGMAGTMIGLASETAAPYDYRMPPTQDIVQVGWRSEAEREIGIRYLESGLDDDPSIPGIFRLEADGRTFTRNRRQFVGDDLWYRSSHLDDFCRPTGVDDFLVSYRVVRRLDVASVFGLSRAWGEEPIGEAERRLVHLFHAELGRVWEAAALTRESGVPQLPPRLRQTLDGLRAGLCEKPIAGKLGLSRHTVHNNVKALHRRFGVSSRGELLARATPRLPVLVPRFNREPV